MKEKRSKEILISQLEGLANSLRKGWILEKGVLGTMRLILVSRGFLKEVEKHYVEVLE